MQIDSATYTNADEDTIRVVSGEEVLFVPVAATNRHYRSVLAWVDEGNVIEAAS